ncbi:MAG: GntR family transcriptional regulator [Gammaproteobacteria bacterium]
MSKALEKAYQLIRERILSGEYAPGSHLKEETISEETAVSRTPVREALRRLSNEQLVKFVPNQGAYVNSWDEDDVDVIYELRIMLEGYSAGRAAQRISQEEIRELEKCVTEIEKLCQHHSRENHRRTIEHNHRFHSIIIEAAGSERVHKMLGWLVEIPMLLKTIERYSDADVERSNHHHREIIAAFKAGDSEWARNVMQTHLRAAYRIYVSAVSEDKKQQANIVKFQ